MRAQKLASQARHGNKLIDSNRHPSNEIALYLILVRHAVIDHCR